MDSEVAPTEPGKPAAADASQPLIGTLEDYSPAGVLQVLSSQGETGAVRFNGEGGCTVYLHEGQLYFAETTDTGEALAIALVRPGRLSPDDWDDATAAGYPTQEVGQELINTGAIDRELLASVVLSVIYDPLISLFRQGEGDFEFEPGTVHWMGPFRTFAVDAIVSEVRRRVREADEMAPLIPTLDVWVESARSLPSDRGTVNLRRDDWEIVVAAAGGRSLPDLAIELGRGMWSTARLVYRLASVHLLDVTASPAEGYVDEAAAGSEPATSGLGAATTAFADTPGFLGEADVETDEPPADTGFADAAPVGPGGFLPAPDEAAEPETLDPVEADDIHDADVVDDPAAPAEDIVDLSSPIAAGEGPPALVDWDASSTDAAPATEGDTWGETAWDDQPWDAPSSTPEGGPSWDAPPPPAAPDAAQAWADEGSWENSSWDQPAAEGATDEADDDHDATVVGLGAAGLDAEAADAPDAPDDRQRRTRRLRRPRHHLRRTHPPPRHRQGPRRVHLRRLRHRHQRHGGTPRSRCRRRHRRRGRVVGRRTGRPDRARGIRRRVRAVLGRRRRGARLPVGGRDPGRRARRLGGRLHRVRGHRPHVAAHLVGHRRRDRPAAATRPGAPRG